jgi:AraC-like DNA-binding protein
MEKEISASSEKIPYVFSSDRHTDVECVVHIHATMEIVIVTQGTLTMTADGIEYNIPEGHGLFIPPFSPHTFRSDKPNLCHVLAFSEVLVPYFFDFIKKNSPTVHLFKLSDASLGLSERLLPDKSNSADYITAEAVLAPLCHDIYTWCRFEPRKVFFGDTFTRVIEYIEAHFREDIDLESIARSVGAHSVTVSKIFSKHTGVGFHYYLQYKRCSHAAYLLKNRNMNISEIAYDSGFGSIRSFNRAFFSVYNITPTQYRKSF